MRTRRGNYQQAATPTATRTPETTPVPTVAPDTTQSNQRNQHGRNENNLTTELEELYTNIKSVPSYSAKISDFLRNYKLHSINRRIVKKVFPRRRVISRFKNDVWQADLIQYETLNYQNAGYKFILLVIDVFSKVIYVEPIKFKTGELTASAMEKILARSESPPVMLVTDGGKEFFNKTFRNVMISHNINHFKTPTKTLWKASVAERANRTIKTKIDRWMQHTRSKRWLDVFRQIVDNYNNTPHSAHKMKPLDVTAENRKIVYKRLYPHSKVIIECRLKKGDKVRKIREKNTKHPWEKGYTPNWSDEIYKIHEVNQKHGVCWYKLSSLSDSVLPGIWYYYQLNLVSRHDS